ncbi:MAG: PAS domain S-box protein, partial [Pseudomonadota bacterium]|nr:PAS domain S-box protein [Pseudomonadota bacterium]
ATTRVPRYAAPAPATPESSAIMMDYFVPLVSEQRYLGTLMMSYDTAAMLDEMVPWWFAQENQIDLQDADENLVAHRAAGGIGRNVYTHQRMLELPGQTLALRTNSVKSAPRLLPNLLVGSVVALTLGLAWSLWALWRDINRRLATEGALREQVSFRTAMENSLVTGMRARDLEGRLTYVNPAFCAMVGMPAETLLGRLPPMPYWVPEATAEYQKRFAEVLAGTVTPQGFETSFQRADGTRFPVLIFESPLLDTNGIQTGWMASILDISEQKRAEDLSRRQQEKLQSSARLASMGEIASTLAHELNQPLAAISSYTTGALNLLDDPNAPPQRQAQLRPALEKAAAQAQRAGQIIRSVHAFVKQREPARSPVQMRAIVDAVEPLIALQAQPSFVQVAITVAPHLPSIQADAVLLEQVLLNLCRNAIESMQEQPIPRRRLHIEVQRSVGGTGQAMLLTAITDQGHGIDEDIAARLFSPFFSTKAEGMGMGLNICRTAVEFHGGSLWHRPNPQGGSVFCFTLPLSEAAAIDGKPDLAHGERNAITTPPSGTP